MFIWYSVGGVTIWEILHVYCIITGGLPHLSGLPHLHRTGLGSPTNKTAMLRRLLKAMLMNELFWPLKLFIEIQTLTVMPAVTCMFLLFFTRKLLPLRMLLTDCLKSLQKKVIVMEVQFTSSPLTDTSLSQAPLFPESVPTFLYSLYLTLYKMGILSKTDTS